MNEKLQQWLDRGREYFTNLSTAKKIAMALLMSAIIVAIGAGVAVFRSDPYQVLYSDLTAEGSAAVAKKLGELKIHLRISGDRQSISVPRSLVHQARMELAKEGLPGEDVVGFEAFDTFSFGTSSYVQRIQYQRAVQGELTRSIQRINAVKRARVHISVPPKKTFLEDQDPPRASVILELQNGKNLTKPEIRGISHIVASAVEGLDHRRVTIVDTRGNFLHRPNVDGDSGISSAILELQRSIEKEYERRIIDLLSPVVGSGKVIAKVTAEIDSTRTSLTEEFYDGEKAVPEQLTKNDQTNIGSRPNPIGIPGSRSNLPGAEVQNLPVPTASMSNTSNISTTKYAIPKKLVTVAKPSGNLKRLTVAVIVDGIYKTDPKNAGQEIFTPRSEEELLRFQEIVSNAVGFDAQRRDSISVSCLPFKTTDLGPEEEINAFNWREFWPQALQNGLVATIIFLFFFLVLRPFLHWATLGDTQREIAVMPKTVAELEVAQQDHGVLALKNAIPVLGSTEIQIEKEEAEVKARKDQEASLIKKIAEKIDESPRKGFRIIQEWLEEDEKKSIVEKET